MWLPATLVSLNDTGFEIDSAEDDWVDEQYAQLMDGADLYDAVMERTAAQAIASVPKLEGTPARVWKVFTDLVEGPRFELYKDYDPISANEWAKIYRHVEQPFAIEILFSYENMGMKYTLCNVDQYGEFSPVISISGGADMEADMFYDGDINPLLWRHECLF